MNTPWTDEEDEYLRIHYRKQPTVKTGKALGRTRRSIIGRAVRLGLSGRAKPTPPTGGFKQPWTPGDPVPDHLKVLPVPTVDYLWR